MNIQRKKITRSLILTIIFASMAMPLAVISREVKEVITVALTTGDTTRAIMLLEKEIGLDPSYEYNYFTLGQIYLKQGDIEKAETEFQKSIDKKKKFWPGVYELGKVKLLLEKLDEAEQLFNKGLKKGKKYKAEFLNGKGLLYMAQKEYDKADTELRKAIIENPDNAEYHFNLGEANFQMGVYYTATAEYEKALKLDTASLDIYFHWAEACLELKDYTCALDKLSDVLNKDSTHAEAWYDAGGIYYKAARSSKDRQEVRELYGKTIGSYQKYIELSNAQPDSSNGRAFYETGKSYLILGGFAETQEYFAKVLSIPIVPKDIYFYYGRSFQALKNYDSAVVNYKKHIEWFAEQEDDFTSAVTEVKLYKRMGECYEALATNYRKAKDKDKVVQAYYNTIDYYLKALAIDSTQARLIYGTAVTYNYLLDYKNAVIYYMKRIALGIDEKYWSIYYNAATSALALAEKGGSAVENEVEDLGLDEDEDFDEAATDDPLAGVDLVDLAIGYLEKVTNDHWEYVVSNEKYKPLAIKALSILGVQYLYEKADCANGVKYLERVLEHKPKDCEAMRLLGFAYYGGICPDNYTKAINYLTQAMDCGIADGQRRCDNVEMLFSLGQVYETRGFVRGEAKKIEESKADYKVADDYYTECLKCDPENQPCKEGKRRVKWEH